MTEYKKLDDDEIAVVLDSCIRRSTGYYDSQISRERKKVVDYYNATLPRPAHDGNSKYVSMDVYDAGREYEGSFAGDIFSRTQGGALCPTKRRRYHHG